MARLLIHVEGQTERAFVSEVLRDHLISVGYSSVEARIAGNPRDRRRSGIGPWPSVRKGIVSHLQEDPGCIVTTMVDYYGLPAKDGKAWPGRGEANRLGSTGEKAFCVEDAILRDLGEEMGKSFDPRRFVPFVVMHEFEGLLFSDCAALSRGVYQPGLEKNFREIREAFATPEDINDSPDTAPSKRVKALLPGYEKPLLGVLAVLEIGLVRIRKECPHFNPGNRSSA